MSENNSTANHSETQQEIKILIADDYEPLRHLLRKRIEVEEDMLVIGEAVDGVEAVTLTNKVSPDIIIMDINMPNKDGIAATKEITDQRSDVRIIAFTFHNNESARKNMIEAGAVAFFSKSDNLNKLCNAIRKIASKDFMIGEWQKTSNSLS